jgi:hypothetical protein
MEQVQINGGTASQIAAYTGMQRQIVADIEHWGKVYIFDGATVGGFLIGGNPAGAPVTVVLESSGTTYVLSTLATAETLVKVTSSASGAKTLSIPAANSYPGYKLYIKMASNVVDQLTTTPLSGTIEGAASWPSSAPDDLQLIADSVNNDWTIV